MRSGTLPVPNIVGLGAACELCRANRSEEAARLRSLRERLRAGIQDQLDDVTLHGQVIPKDSKVLLLTGSAGRDERMYPDADRFDIHRRFDQHMSFGYGIHFCLGAALARLEGKVALEETLKRFPTWEVDWEHAVQARTSTVRGWETLPVFTS